MIWNCLGIFLFFGVLMLLLLINTIVESQQAGDEIHKVTGRKVILDPDKSL